MHNQNQPQHAYNPQVPPHTTGAQPNNGHNPYEFILQADAKPPKEPTSFAKKLLIVLGGVFLLFVLIAVGLSIFLPGKGASEGVIAIATEQQAIAELADSVATTTQSVNVKAFALNVHLSVQSDQKTLVAYIANSGTKIDEKTLSAGSDTEALAKLEAAKDSPEYDTTARRALGASLQTYATNLATTYKQTDDDVGKQAIQQAYVNAKTLLDQNAPVATE